MKVRSMVNIKRDELPSTIVNELPYQIFYNPAKIVEISKDKKRVRVNALGELYWFDREALEEIK